MKRLACLALVLVSACGGKLSDLSDAGPGDASADALADATSHPPPPPPPTTDAQPPPPPPPDDGGPPPPPGQCNNIAPGGPLVSMVQVPQSPPTFTTGGSIPDGTYLLQKFVDYTGPNGGSSTLGFITVTVQVSGSTWQIASEQGQQPINRLTIAVKSDPSTLYFSPVCGNSGSSNVLYESAGGVLTLIAKSNQDTFVESYVKQ